MGLRKSTRKFVDLRKAASDIAESAKSNAPMGRAIESLGKSGRRLTEFLKNKIPL